MWSDRVHRAKSDGIENGDARRYVLLLVVETCLEDGIRARRARREGPVMRKER